MGFGLYSVRDPSQFVAGSAAGAGATASRMMKEQPEKPGPTAGGMIAAGMGAAMMGATVASDIGRAKGLPKTAPTVRKEGAIPGHKLETAETAAAALKEMQKPGPGMTQGKFEKYGAGVGALAGMAAHFFS